MVFIKPEQELLQFCLETIHQYPEFYKILKQLEKYATVNNRPAIHFEEIERLEDTNFDAKNNIVSLAKEIKATYQYYVLIHECAHALLYYTVPDDIEIAQSFIREVEKYKQENPNIKQEFDAYMNKGKRRTLKKLQLQTKNKLKYGENTISIFNTLKHNREIIFYNDGYSSLSDLYYTVYLDQKEQSLLFHSRTHSRSYYENSNLKPKDSTYLRFSEIFAHYTEFQCLNQQEHIQFTKKILGDKAFSILEQTYRIALDDNKIVQKYPK